MKSKKVFVQRLNQEFKRLYPTRNIVAKKCGAAINLYIIKRIKWWVFTLDRRVNIGQVSMFCYYETYLKIKNQKLKLAIDDVAYEYYGEDLAWMDDDEWLAADRRANAKKAPVIKKQIVIEEDQTFNIHGAL